MRDPTILFVKPGAISASDKEAVRDAGVIVIEIDDITNAKLVKASAELDGSDLLRAAAQAIIKGADRDTKIAFANAVCAALDSLSAKGA